MSQHIVLSPHYDDAVYSCGGMIAQHTAAGELVEIFTLMAGTPSLPLPDTPVLRDNHGRWDAGENPVQQRRAEDEAAAAIVGASVRYATLLDCIYRTANGAALYPDEVSLWERIHPDDPAPGQLRALELTEGAQVYAPLGVGAHVDHLLVRDWALALQQTRPDLRVTFYAEYPYLRQPEAVDAALASASLPLVPQFVMLDEAAMQRKIAAMKAYRSQISSFWKDVAAVDAEVRQTFASPQGGYAERFYAPAEVG